MTSNPTLVLIPALGCDERLYRDVLPSLARKRAVRVIIAAAPRFSDMVTHVLEQAPAEFAVLGTSMGARLALEVTLAAPARVRGLMMIGSGAGATADPVGGLRRVNRISSGEHHQVIDEMAEKIAHLPGPRGAMTAELFRQMGRSFDVSAFRDQADALAHRDDLCPRLASIRCPALCIWGEHDQFSPPVDGKDIAAAMGGEYREIMDCGHFPTLEYPAETLDILRASGI